ncbi:MAG: hypothetical protein JKY17_08770 [Magnetovibrio sp.]|nr:hypothetical protein [Magnetovibrio sp.]
MINIKQFRKDVVRPILKELDLWSPDAEELVIGTAAHESGLTYLKQMGGGPALGMCQMEPTTHDDIWANYLRYQTAKSAALKAMFGPAAGDARHMTWNIGYAVAMCRVHYLRQPGALPLATNIDGQAAYWKKYYNTPLGAGTIEEYVKNYQRIVGV